MNKPLAVAAVALSLTGGLVLTACGGSGDSASDKITGAPTATSATASPSSSPTAGALPTGAPEIRLPADVRVEIEEPGAGADEATGEAIRDLEYAIRALQDGFAQGSGTVPSMLHAYGMQSGLYWSKQIQQYKDAGKAITGTDRYYNIDMRIIDGKSALAHYCEDQRKSYSKDLKTGKINVTTPSDKDFYRFTVSLGFDPKTRVWKIDRQNWTQGDKSCITG
ncbi:hypothetical protein [Streptomyces sp.]|uniref:hypothetical protein n=1 Tax=Streptomyces sp. TaxID=1931 RepID=UPI002F3EEF44